MSDVIRGIVNGLAALGINVGSERVAFGELPNPPRIVQRDNRWEIQTGHSRHHSGKEIYRVDLSREGLTVVLRAWQRLVTTATGAPFRKEMMLPKAPGGLGSSNPEWVWEDRDGSRHPLAVSRDDEGGPSGQ